MVITLELTDHAMKQLIFLITMTVLMVTFVLRVGRGGK